MGSERARNQRPHADPFDKKNGKWEEMDEPEVMEARSSSPSP